MYDYNKKPIPKNQKTEVFRGSGMITTREPDRIVKTKRKEFRHKIYKDTDLGHRVNQLLRDHLDHSELEIVIYEPKRGKKKFSQTTP